MGRFTAAEAIMRLSAKACFMTAVLTASLPLYGQQQQGLSDPNLLAKLSFDSSGVVESQGIEHICMAVSRDGAYRMIRRPVRDSLSSDPARLTERIQGAMSEQQLQQLKTLLDSSELRSLSGSHSGIIRQSAQTFGAEIPISDKQVSDGVLHLQWVDGDGKSPFPPPVNKIVVWLHHFEPVNAKPLANLEVQDVCPSVGLERLQPSVASKLP
jgi:hypothetical protein